jgi:hypothetical protein
MTDDAQTMGEGSLLNRDTASITVLSIIGAFGISMSGVSVSKAVEGGMLSLISPDLVFLVLVALPVVYSTAISLQGFRKEAFASFIVLPGFVLGGRMEIAAIGVPLAVLLTAYISRSVYNDRNYYYTFYRASGSMVFIFALVSALIVGHGIYTDSEVRDSIQQRIAGETTDLALATVNGSLPTTGAAGGGNGGSIDEAMLEQQKKRILDWSETVAHNSSTLTLIMTQRQMMSRVREEDIFTTQHEQILSQEFQQARNEIPPLVAGNVTERTRQRLDQQLSTDSIDIGGDGQDQQQDQGTGLGMRDMVKDQVNTLLDTVFHFKAGIAALIAVTVFSTIMIFKLPVGFVLGFVGYIIHKTGRI